MNIFTDIVFIFVFVFVILHFKLISITETNVVFQKIFLFITVSLFATALHVMKTIRRQKPVNMFLSFNDGLLIGLLAFIGHTLLFDLWYMPDTNNWLTNMVDNKYITLNVLVAMFISSSIIVGKSTTYIFKTEPCN
jgi:hypothetical protein